jgi:hypothetical protein
LSLTSTGSGLSGKLGPSGLVIAIAFAALSCAGQKGDAALSGRYRRDHGSELLILGQDHSFVCLRGAVRRQDVVVPECDTLASGSWQERKGFIGLKNREGFNRIDYAVTESLTGSPDSLYFRVLLPGEDALTDGRFRYSIWPVPLSKIFRADNPEFAVVNMMKGRVNFGLSIQDLAPNCGPGAGCRQRIYFDVFQDYRPASARANTFVITLSHFNQCFYEAMDLDNEIIGVSAAGLFWRGGVYKRVKE